MGRIAQQVSLERLVADYVPPDATVAIGGLHFHNTPMAVVRELIRQEVRIDRVVPPVDGSINVDQLVGAGLVREVHAPYVGLEHFGMAPRFRAAAEAGRIRVRETEEAGYILGLQAAAAGLPFAVLPEGFFPEPDPGRRALTVPEANPDDYAIVEDPFTGRTHHAARAIRPDVALVHCQAVDERGNGAFLGSAFFDIEMAKASARCVVLTEELVRELPDCDEYLPGYFVDAFAVVAHGAHPAASHGLYRYDEEHIRRYVEQARTDEGFARYRAEVIGDSEAAYQAAHGRVA